MTVKLFIITQIIAKNEAEASEKIFEHMKRVMDIKQVSVYLEDGRKHDVGIKYLLGVDLCSEWQRIKRVKGVILTLYKLNGKIYTSPIVVENEDIKEVSKLMNQYNQKYLGSEENHLEKYDVSHLVPEGRYKFTQQYVESKKVEKELGAPFLAFRRCPFGHQIRGNFENHVNFFFYFFNFFDFLKIAKMASIFSPRV
jgi:hypothetical protein